MADWEIERRTRKERMKAGSVFAEGKMVAEEQTTAPLEAVIRALSHLMREVIPDADIHRLAEFHSLGGFLRWVKD